MSLISLILPKGVLATTKPSISDPIIGLPSVSVEPGKMEFILMFFGPNSFDNALSYFF